MIDSSTVSQIESMSFFDMAAILVTVSALFGYINHRFIKLPHTIALVLMALTSSLCLIALDFINPNIHIAAQLTQWLIDVDFNKTLMHGMLSFMLFAGAMQVNFSAFGENSHAIGVMALFGTLVSTFIVGFLMWWLLNIFSISIPFIWALVFGALISPTDPVAVLGLFKTVKVPETLKAKIAGESLFNDGVGVVIFTAALLIASNEGADSVSFTQILLLFVTEAMGGALLGFIAGYLCYRTMASIDEYNIEVLLTLALVMGVYSLSIHLEMSGPIAMVVAGLIIGNKGLTYAVSDKSRDYLIGFWSLLDEILNSVLFLLIGMEVLLIASRLDHLEVALLAIPVTLLARCISVFLSLKLVTRWVPFMPGTVAVLTWGGLRGGIAVALALSLPSNEYKVSIITITYAVVIFSIVVQGLSVQSLVEKLMPTKQIDTEEL